MTRLPSAAPSRATSERGFAILIVLWTLVLVALIVTHMVTAARQETQLASNLRNEAELGAMADGGIHEAIFHVLDKSSAHWAADGVPHRVGSRLGSMDIVIRSEAGRVNLNTAPVELLAALLHATGVDRQAADTIAANIVVWRSPSDGSSSMAAAYQQSGRGYAPPGAPFESVGELGNVLGVTPDILGKVAPYLTIYHDGDTDPSVAAPVVRQALQDVYGSLPVGSRAGPDESAVYVSVVARRGVAQAAREATIRLVPTPAGSLYQVMDWRTVS